MCDTCTRLALEVDLLTLETQVISAEVEVGENWSGASRTLHAHEVEARVLFGDLDRLHLESSAMVARHADVVRQAAIRALLEDLANLGAGDDPYAILARLQKLASPTSGTALPLADVIDAATRQITETLAATQAQSAAAVVDEARRQGLTSGVLPDQRTLRPTAADRASLAVRAREVAESPLARILAVATQEARTAVTPRTSPAAVVDAVHSAITAISPSGVEDLARQATTNAVNLGRAAAAAASPEPREVYASELLDGRTCAPCSHVDGRMYESLDAALVDYPSGGSYRGCLGGSRCRGTLVFVWDTEQAPSLDHPGDRPLPVHTIDRTPKGPSTEPAVVVPPVPEPGAGTPGGPTIPPPAAAAADFPDDGDLTGIDAAELEARMLAASAAQDWDRAARYGDELDRRDRAAALDEAPHTDPEADFDAFNDEANWVYNNATAQWEYQGPSTAAAREAKQSMNVFQKREASKRAFAEHVDLELNRAEAATRGNLIRRDRLAEFKERYGTDPSVLFSARVDVAYRYASPELRDYWEEHPRLTASEMMVRFGITDPKVVAAAERAEKARQDAAIRAEEDPERRKKRQQERRRKRGEG